MRRLPLRELRRLREEARVEPLGFFPDLWFLDLAWPPLETGALMANTAVPVWHDGYRTIPFSGAALMAGPEGDQGPITGCDRKQVAEENSSWFGGDRWGRSTRAEAVGPRDGKINGWAVTKAAVVMTPIDTALLTKAARAPTAREVGAA